MNDNGLRRQRHSFVLVLITRSSLILHPSSFIFHPSSFIRRARSPPPQPRRLAEGLGPVPARFHRTALAGRALRFARANRSPSVGTARATLGCAPRACWRRLDIACTPAAGEPVLAADPPAHRRPPPRPAGLSAISFR